MPPTPALFKGQLQFGNEPRRSLNMHTFPSVRDMDRAVRGTPSSAARRNREENSGQLSSLSHGIIKIQPGLDSLLFILDSRVPALSLAVMSSW
ncbi:uncharacterized protein AAEQ78_023736 isoform 2-T2 [Lycaon pictus]